MNARMNGSQFVPPPPALCLRFPVLQACTEDLPLVLQKPDNFPLVMGILQEINHEKVGFSSQVDSTYAVLQRPCEQQTQMPTFNTVKLENLEVEDHPQHSFNSNPDLYQEWSLKGVEELLTNSEEFQLRHDCYQQAHETAENLDLSSAQEEKPLLGLHSSHSQFNQSSSDEARLQVDEKPALCSKLPSSLKELVPLQGRVSRIKEFSEANPGPQTLQAALLANNKRYYEQSQACLEDSLGLDNLRVVKREPEGQQNWPAKRTSMPSEVVRANENEDHIITTQSKDRLTSNTDTEGKKSRKTTLLGHISSATKDACSGLPEEGETSLKLKDKMMMDTDHELENQMKIALPESDLQLNLGTRVSKRWTVHNILRCTSAILAGPAEFTEQEEIQVLQKPPSTSNSSAAEAPMCSTVSGEGGLGSQQVSSDLQGERKHDAVSSEADSDFCELTLSLGTSQPQTAICLENVVGRSLHEEKPLFKNLFVQEEHHGQCQRTNQNQWQRATRCGTCKVFSSPVYKEKPLFPPTSLDGGVCRRALQLMPHSSEDGGSDVENGGVEEPPSEDDQLAEPNQNRGKESTNLLPSEVTSQIEQMSKFKEPPKKRMRGTLHKEDKGDGSHKEDIRCHRSDGKSWRCARECVNGAYYCQYHLRARRIGYNRRKNRDTYTGDLESIKKKSLKSGKKSRQLLSILNRNSEP